MKADTKSYPEPVGAALWLGEQSPLAGVLPGFSPRPGQLELAQAVERCYRQQLPLIAEAGTGTGKTLAYLIPAVLSGLKTVVSTGTRTLQDQVSGKELPLLKAALAPELRWAVLKGRANYLCLRRYEDFARQPDLGLPGAPGALAYLGAWARSTPDGDLDQVRGQAVAPAVLAEVTASAEQCLAGRCPRRDECWLMEARRRAAEAEIVVVNHHLFLADLALKAAGHGEALPRYQAVIFDEAHLVAEVATQVFGVSVSSLRLLSLVKDVLREAPATPAEAMAACRQAADAFFAAAARLAGPGASAALGPEQLKRLAPAGRALAEALDGLAAALGAGDANEALAARALAIGLDLSAVAQPVAGQSVAWAAVKGRAVAVNLSPVEVAPHLQHALYDHLGRLVFTSATLAALGDLEPARQRLGLPPESSKLSLASPFDQTRQALLYVPKAMPPPQAAEFPAAVAEQVERLLKCSRGRAFVLFTTHRNLETVSRLLAPRLPYPCLVQGQAPRMELLKRFVAESPSVLFATASFWQGVDVPGPALSAVIVDKLPFAPPDDPLLAARAAKLEAEGLSSFAHLTLPEAILTLKQGLGRLLRTPEDRGVLAVLDVRLVSKGYGRQFLKALAPAPVTHDLADVARFFGDDGEGRAAAGD